VAARGFDRVRQNRGRPFLESGGQTTGGHGGPPLQSHQSEPYTLIACKLLKFPQPSRLINRISMSVIQGTRVRNMRTAYALGLVAVVLAVLLRWLLDPVMGDALPLVTLFGAVAAAAWLGGYRVAIPVTFVGYFACHYLFIAPRGHFNLSDQANVVGLVAYLFTCALIIVFGEAARVAQSRSTQGREVMRVTLRSAPRRFATSWDMFRVVC